MQRHTISACEDHCVILLLGLRSSFCVVKIGLYDLSKISMICIDMSVMISFTQVLCKRLQQLQRSCSFSSINVDNAT
jgi:hypothetical protein